jgi:ankyrin repeat protein
MLLNDLEKLNYPLIFLYAVEQNNNKIIQLLLEYIYDLDILDEYNYLCETPLNKAAFNGNLELCSFLINNNVHIQGLDENDVIKINSTPLLNAVQSRNYKLIKYLLKNGADPNIWSYTGHGNYGDLPLHISIENNDYKIAKLLILYGADPTKSFLYSCKYGIVNHISPLELAKRQNKIKILKLFKYYNEVLTHKEYLEIRNKYRIELYE